MPTPQPGELTPIIRQRPLRTLAAVGALMAVAVAASACGDPASSSASTEKLTLVSQPNGAGLPLYVAQKHGFFEDVGLEVEIKYYTIGASALAAGAKGEWQAGWMGAPPALTGMNQFGLIPAGLMIQEDENHIMFMSEKVLEDSTPAEVLKTHSVATAQNSLAEQVMFGCAEHFGVDPKGVEVVNLDPGAIVQALQTDKVQVINSWSSPDFPLLDDPKYQQVCDGAMSGVHVLDPFVVNPDFAEDRPEAAAKFIAAVYQANEFINANHDQAVQDMMDIYQENGLDGSEAMADYEINIRQWYSLDKALEGIKDGSTAAGLEASAQFFVDKGVYPQMPPIEELLKQGLTILEDAEDIDVSGSGS